MGECLYFGRSRAWQETKLSTSPLGEYWYAEYEADIARGVHPDPIDAVYEILNLLGLGRRVDAKSLAQHVETHVEFPRSPFHGSSPSVIDWMLTEGLLEAAAPAQN